MAFNLTALFIDSRREFPQRFVKQLSPQVNFSAVDRVSRLAEAVQKFLLADYQVCFISDTITDPISDFFIDIARSGKKKSCAFVKILSNASVSKNEIEGGFTMAALEEMLPDDRIALLDMLRDHWKKTEVERRTEDLDGSINQLMRVIDGAASAKRRGRNVILDRGATSLVRMHTEFDQSILTAFLDRLSSKLDGAQPMLKLLKKAPLAILDRELPELYEDGYRGASNRVSEMLLERFGELVGSSSDTKEKEGK